jgi:hypothetical protein
MKNPVSAVSKKSSFFLDIFLVVAISMSIMHGCAGTTQTGAGRGSDIQKASAGGTYDSSTRTYADNTNNFKVILPNSGWTINPSSQTLGDALQIAELERDEYSLYTSLAVSKHYQKSLERFASVGTYNPKESKFTYIAGKPAFFMSKKMEKMGFELRSIAYKFVHNGKGYLFSIAYPSQFTGHEPLEREIDELLNSFTFLDEEKGATYVSGSQGMTGKADISVSGAIKGDKLTNVAVLDMVDLHANAPSAKTTILTNELQNMLTGTGKFECLDRRNMEQILKEQHFQQSGMISGSSAMQIGQLLGAHYLISSNLGRIGETSVIYMQITNAENGKILKTASSRCRKCSDDMLLEAISRLVNKFTSL